MPTVKRPWSSIVPWSLSFILLGALLYLAAHYQPPSNLELQQSKTEISLHLLEHLQTAIEAEKNAVLSVKSQESKGFAAQVKSAGQALETQRQALESLTQKQSSPSEKNLLAEFDRCWGQFKVLDQQLLAWAAQESNIEAQNWSTQTARKAWEEFEQALNSLRQNPSSAPFKPERAAAIDQSQIASLKILALHKPHIEAFSEREMQQWEKEMQTQTALTQSHLSALSQSLSQAERPKFQLAQKQWLAFQAATDKIIALSRQNTNLKSLELSLGKKRLIASQCKGILNELQAEYASQRFQATR